MSADHDIHREDGYQLAEAHLREGRYDEAITLYRKLVAMSPEEESFLLALAWAYHDSERLPEAVACFETLFARELARRVFTGFAYDELVRIYKDQSRFDDLVVVCERAVAAQPEDMALLGELGEAYLKAGRAGAAVRVFESMVVREPDDPIFFTHLGNARLAAGDPDGADAAYGRAMDIGPPLAPVLFSRLANLYLDAGYPDRAEKAIRASIARCPDDPLYWYSLGDILIALKKVQDAWEAYGQAVDRDRSSSGIYYNRLGKSLARTGHYPQAIEAYREAIREREEERNPFYYLHLAEAYAARGLMDEAAEALQRAEALR